MVFHKLKESNLPPSEMTVERMSAEATAGTETKARTLAVITFYVENRDIWDKPQTELRTVLPTRETIIQLFTLEQLCYLTAVVNEGLRLAHGVSSRQPRIATQETLQCGDWAIPGRRRQTIPLPLTHGPRYISGPFTFSPQRRLDDPKLTKYLNTFGRGSRKCLGMNSVMAELYAGLAYVLRSFKFESFETIK